MRQLSWSKFLWGIFPTFIFHHGTWGSSNGFTESYSPWSASCPHWHYSNYLISNNCATCGLVPISAPTLQSTFVSTLTFSKGKWLVSIILTNDFYWNWICQLLWGIWVTPAGHLIDSRGAFDWLPWGIWIWLCWLQWRISLTLTGHLIDSNRVFKIEYASSGRLFYWLWWNIWMHIRFEIPCQSQHI